jgi:hypothetical protein
VSTLYGREGGESRLVGHAPAPADHPARAYGERDETCPVSTEGWTRRVHFVWEGGGGTERPQPRAHLLRRAHVEEDALQQPQLQRHQSQERAGVQRALRRCASARPRPLAVRPHQPAPRGLAMPREVRHQHVVPARLRPAPRLSQPTPRPAPPLPRPAHPPSRPAPRASFRSGGARAPRAGLCAHTFLSASRRSPTSGCGCPSRSQSPLPRLTARRKFCSSCAPPPRPALSRPALARTGRGGRGGRECTVGTRVGATVGREGGEGERGYLFGFDARPEAAHQREDARLARHGAGGDVACPHRRPWNLAAARAQRSAFRRSPRGRHGPEGEGGGGAAPPRCRQVGAAAARRAASGSPPPSAPSSLREGRGVSD